MILQSRRIGTRIQLLSFNIEANISWLELQAKLTAHT